MLSMQDPGLGIKSVCGWVGERGLLVNYDSVGSLNILTNAFK